MSSPIHVYEPRARWGHGAVEVKGNVYIWGGEDSDGNPYSASLVEVFNIRTGHWEQRIARGVAPIGVIYCAYTTIGDKLYTFSGRGKGRTYFNTLHQLNLKTMKWKKLASRNPADAPTSRRGCTMISYGNDKLVTFGGYDANNEYSNDLHLYNLRDGVWSRCQVSGDSEVPLPTGYGTFLRVDEFKAILFGGATRKGRRNDTYCLIMPKHLSDQCTWKWVKQGVLSKSSKCPARSGHGASVVKCRKGRVKGVLIYGGLQDTYNTPLNDAWFLDVSGDDFTSSSWKQVKLPVEIEARCDPTISVISSSTSQSAHILLYGGQHKWAQQTVAETTLMILFTSGKREMTIVDCAVITDAVKWNERVLLLQTLDKVKTEMNKGKTVRRKVASMLFIGPPQTGKTTVMHRIQNPELTAPTKSTSTPIAEGPMHVAIEKAVPTLALFEKQEWTAQSLKEEKSHLLSCTLPSDEPSEVLSTENTVDTMEDIGATKDAEEMQASPKVPTTSKQPRKGLFRGLVRRRRHEQKLARSDSISSVTSALSITFETPEDMYRELLLVKNRKRSKDDNCISLHLLDTGGQPEFMDILPLLLSCPSLIVLVFNMNTKLTDRYVVEYVSPDGSRAVPYESSFTVEEVLLQTLASVAHSSSVSLPLSSGNQPLFEKDRLQSVAVFVGTHLDQVSKDQVEEINDFLTCKVQDISVPDCKIISYNNTVASESLPPSYRYLFALNNTVPHDPGLLTLRNVLTEVLHEEFGLCEVPHSWLMFYLSVRSTQARILSFQNCKKIAGGCGISDDSELRLMLWFLSNYWGVFRYYPEVPGLQEIVIVDLQILFDAITKLITRAFEFGRQQQASNVDVLIKECGRFPLHELEHLLKINDFKSHTEISVGHFILLLEHMHIIASISDGEKKAKEYFFPCVLKPYPVERLTVNPEQSIPPLLVVFESGYCPLGLFNALVLELAKCDAWHMARFSMLSKESKQYRNKLVYHVGEAEDRITLIAHPKFIEIQIERTVKSMKNITKVCYEVRGTIEKSIEKVKTLVAASQDNYQHFAFHCHGEHLPGDICAAAHPAIVQIHVHVPEKKMLLPSFVRCSITERLIPLSAKQQLWFGDPSSIEAIESINLEDIDNTELCGDSLHAVFCEVAEVTRWRELGSTLGLEKSTLDHIEAEQDKIICNCIREVMVCWLKRKDSVQVPSWQSLVCALNTGRVNHSDIALKISARH